MAETIAEQLDAIEKSMADTRSLLELLLALRLVRDGHAASMRDGLEIARDVEQVRLLYPLVVES